MTMPYSASPASGLKQNLLDATGSVHELPRRGSAKIYFPQDLVGGVCQWVAGAEEETVWRAAAAACGTERVHAVWQAFNGRIFFLAVKSEEMASHHDTWCPFAALLPGMKDAVVAPVCYTFYTQGSAAMMVVTPDGLQVYRGIGLIARAKAERAARELGNAPIIELTSDRIAQMTPRAWHSASLYEERARRVLAALSVSAALFLAALAFVVWIYAGVSLVRTRMTLATHADHVQKDAMNLLGALDTTRLQPLHQQLADFVRVNDGILALDGFMRTYQVQGGQVSWRATVKDPVDPEALRSLEGVVEGSPVEGKVTIGRGGDAPSAKSGKGH